MPKYNVEVDRAIDRALERLCDTLDDIQRDQGMSDEAMLAHLRSWPDVHDYYLVYVDENSA